MAPKQWSIASKFHKAILARKAQQIGIDILLTMMVAVMMEVMGRNSDNQNVEAISYCSRMKHSSYFALPLSTVCAAFSLAFGCKSICLMQLLDFTMSIEANAHYVSFHSVHFA